MTATALTGEHAFDVLMRLNDWQQSETACALVMITHTEGGAVRAPGALLAVSAQDSLGYISGGCIDADVVLNARVAIQDQTMRELRYGAGSPFVDLPLPCGGAIEVLILPTPSPDAISQAHAYLQARQPIYLRAAPTGELICSTAIPRTTDPGPYFMYEPKLRLRISGRGADALALAKISTAAGYETLLQLVDEEDLVTAREAGLQTTQKLTSARDLPENKDDAWTAFILLFHDQDWEPFLLRQALAGPAFYIGAVGSQRTHQIRCDRLRTLGLADSDLTRIHGPIGLVSSLRDASMLAISTLAEVIDQFTDPYRALRHNTALVLLAAGASKRYEQGDKLLADFKGDPVLDHAARLRSQFPAARAIAIVAEHASDRARILSEHNWEIIENADAATGQSSSVVAGLKHLQSDPQIEQVLIVLGDMPNVCPSHLHNMLHRAQDPGITCIMSESATTLYPPALFKRRHFDSLLSLTGDRGAKAVFEAQAAGALKLPISAQEAIDIDVVADLLNAKAVEDG